MERNQNNFKIGSIVYGFLARLRILFFSKKFKAESFKKRQNYHIGWLASGKTLEDLKAHLHGEWGFGGQFFHVPNDNEVLSWRKLTSDGKKQYHLRVFSDGEIRGHFEASPETHPLSHIKGETIEEARADFLKFLGDFVTYQKNVSNLTTDKNEYEPPSEMVSE